jgi:hypothetical protein
MELVASKADEENGYGYWRQSMQPYDIIYFSSKNSSRQDIDRRGSAVISTVDSKKDVGASRKSKAYFHVGKF